MTVSIMQHKGKERDILYTPRQDGKLVFPCLQSLTLMSYDHGNEDEKRKQAIDIARIRSRTPGVSPLKMISVHENYASDSLIEELEKYVPIVERNKGPIYTVW